MSVLSPIKLYFDDLFPYNNFLFIIVASHKTLPFPTPPSSANPPAFIPAIALLFLAISLSFEPLPDFLPSTKLTFDASGIVITYPT